MHPHQPPFQYSKPYVPFDWKELYGLNLENALARNDFRVFGTVASSLAFGDIETPFRQGGVPEDVVRLASVQQYLAQYLLHMQDVLMHEIDLARANPPPSPDIQALLAERDALRKQLRIERAKRQTDAMMLRLASVNPETVNMLFRCHVCGKVFADYHFLVSHYEKRHEGIQPIQPPPFKPPQHLSRIIVVSCTCYPRLWWKHSLLSSPSQLSRPHGLCRHHWYQITPNPRSRLVISSQTTFLTLHNARKFTGFEPQSCLFIVAE